MKTTTVVVSLQLDEGGRSFAGSVESGSGPAPFTGWIGLLAALDRAIADAFGAPDDAATGFAGLPLPKGDLP